MHISARQVRINMKARDGVADEFELKQNNNMSEVIDTLRSNLNSWGELAEVILNALSLLCIVIGIIVTSVRSLQYRQRSPGAHPLHTYFRMIFGGWLVVALEFQLAADVVGTMISPTAAHLVELGTIAVIRTFLNYFLGRELKEENELMEGRVERTKEAQPEPIYRPNK